jgi:hypothetical protein
VGARRAYDPPAMTDLEPAVSRVIRRCLGVEAGENVVVQASLEDDGCPVLDVGRYVLDRWWRARC